MQAFSGENYEFQAKPQVVHPKQKQKYREVNLDDEDNQLKTGFQNNLMFDKRVVRGNTYAASVISKNQDKEKLKKEQTLFKKPGLKTQVKKLQKQVIKTQTAKNIQPQHSSTPRPTMNRKNMDCQTDEYVETLMDRPAEQDQEIQTDFYIDKPPERLFKPKKYGVDRETQIWEGELFDFDQEVEPILQVLTNKTLEQGRMEVLEEEELKLMQLQQKQFEKIRNAELVEMQRLEAVQRRLDEDEQRRILQYQTARQQAIFSHQKLICGLISKNLLKNFKTDSFRKLEDLGVFRNPLIASLYSDFVPWIYQQIYNELNQQQNVQEELNQFLQDVSGLNQENHRLSLQNQAQKKTDILNDRIKKKQIKEDNKKKKEEKKKKDEEKKQRQLVNDKLTLEFKNKPEIKVLQDLPHTSSEFIDQMKKLSQILGGIVMEQKNDPDNFNFKNSFIQDIEDLYNILYAILSYLTMFEDYANLTEYLNSEIQTVDQSLKFDYLSIIPKGSLSLYQILLALYFSQLIQMAIERKLREFGVPAADIEQIFITSKQILEFQDKLINDIENLDQTEEIQ